jgi:ATP-dependent Clp protease ATP-binding subunit ClpA
MLAEVNHTLANQNIQVVLTAPALQELAKAGFDPEFGARPMRRMIQKTVENAIAVKILSGQAAPGSTITLDVADLQTDKSAMPTAPGAVPVSSAPSTTTPPPTPPQSTN